MLKWLSGSTTTSTQQHNDSDKTDEEQAAAAAPSFPMPGSIQRVGGSSLKRLEKQEEGTSAGDSDQDDEDTNAIANMDLHISPPSPVSSKPPKVATSALEALQQDSNSEFKVPTVSFTVSAPSSVNTPAMTSAKAKPKPSHRPFPPDPSSTILPAQTLNNGRVTLSNGSNGATLGSSLGLPHSTTVKPRKQRFVALEPGYSPLDWARLNREGDDDELRVGACMYISLSSPPAIADCSVPVRL